MRERLLAILFFLLIPICPILVVVILPPPDGGIFIVGFMMGAAFLPLLVTGTIQAAAILFFDSPLQGIWGVTTFLIGVIVISVLAASWSFYAATG